MNNVAALTSTTNGVLQFASFPAENNSSTPSKSRREWDFFSDNPYDRILTFAKKRGIADSFGVVVEPRNPYEYTQFNSAQWKFLENIVRKKIEIHSKQPGLPVIKVSPKEFFERLRKDAYLAKKLKGTFLLSGGAARAMFNPTSLTEIWSSVFKRGKLKGVFQHFHERLPDYDFAISITIDSIEEQVEIRRKVIDVLHSLYPPEKGVTREEVEKKGFRPLDLHWNENQMLIVKIGNDEQQIEFKLFNRVQRPCLFTVDAWAVDVNPLVFGKGKCELRCLIPEHYWQCLFDLSARLIRAYDLKSINKFGWPRMIMHITNRYRCLQSSLDKILWEAMCKYEPPCNLFRFLKEGLANHFPNDYYFAKVCFINASLHIEDPVYLSYLWHEKAPAYLSPAIQAFLQNEKTSFSDVRLMLQVAAIVQYASGCSSVTLTQHLDKVHFQIRGQGATILVCANPTAIKDWGKRLKGLDESLQNQFFHTFDRLCEEFNLMPLFCVSCRNRNLPPMFNNFLSGLSSFITAFKERCPPRILAALSSLKDESSNIVLTSLAPELRKIFGQGHVSRILEGYKLTTQTQMEWVAELLQTDDSEFVRAAWLCWRRLLEKTSSTSLVALSHELALKVAQREGINLGIEVVEYARKKQVWHTRQEQYVKVLFAILSLHLGKNGGRYTNSDVIWLECEKLRKMILETLDLNPLGDDLSERVKKGILWLVRNYALHNEVNTAISLFQTAMNHKWIRTDHEEYVMTHAALVREYLKQKHLSPTLDLSEEQAIPIINIARKSWAPEEKERFFTLMLEFLREKDTSPQRQRTLSKTFYENHTLVGGLNTWEVLFDAMLENPSEERVVRVWNLLSEYILPLCLHREPLTINWEWVAQQLEKMLFQIKENSYGCNRPDREILYHFFQKGLEGYCSHSVQLAQSMERQKLFPEIDWNRLLSKQSPPRNIDGVCRKIIHYWIDCGEVDIAETWLISSCELYSNCVLYERLVLKRLELGAGPELIQKIIKAGIPLEEKWKLWEKILSRFLRFSQDNYVVESLKIFQVHLSKDKKKPQFLHKYIPRLLKIISKPKILDRDLFLQLMDWSSSKVPQNMKYWEEFLFASLKANKANKGWEVLKNVPVGLIDEVDTNLQWSKFFCSLTANNPELQQEVAADPGWKKWFQRHQNTSNGRQIMLYIEYGLFLLRRRNGSSKAVESLQHHLDQGMVALSRVKREDELTSVSSTLIREFMRRNDPDGVYWAQDLLGKTLGPLLKKNRNSGDVVKQCNGLLLRSKEILISSSSHKKKENILSSARFLLEACQKHKLEGVNLAALEEFGVNGEVPLFQGMSMISAEGVKMTLTACNGILLAGSLAAIVGIVAREVLFDNYP